MMLDKAFGGKSDATLDCHIDRHDEEELNSFEMMQFRKWNFDKKFAEECVG